MKNVVDQTPAQIDGRETYRYTDRQCKNDPKRQHISHGSTVGEKLQKQKNCTTDSHCNKDNNSQRQRQPLQQTQQLCTHGHTPIHTHIHTHTHTHTHTYIHTYQRRHTRYDRYDHGRTTFGQGWSAKVVQKSDKKMLTSYDRTRHVHA